MEFEAVAAAVGDLPYMEPKRARELYAALRESGARDALEIGTAHGAGTAYIAAALAANGGGRLTTLDHEQASWDPPPQDVLARAGLLAHVDVVRIPHSSYAWWLKEEIERRSDDAGNCDPRFDFCYLDGLHHWVLDGFSAMLVEKLLRPGGWLLLDDLAWTFAENPAAEPAASNGVGFELSNAERGTPHLRAVFDLVLRQHPSFTEFRIVDEYWGWARKAPGEPRRLELHTTASPAALAAAWMRYAMRRRSVRKAIARRPTS